VPPDVDEDRWTEVLNGFAHEVEQKARPYLTPSLTLSGRHSRLFRVFSIGYTLSSLFALICSASLIISCFIRFFSFIFFSFVPSFFSREEEDLDPNSESLVDEEDDQSSNFFDSFTESEPQAPKKGLLHTGFLRDDPLYVGAKTTILGDVLCALFVFFLTSHLSKVALQGVLDLQHALLPPNYPNQSGRSAGPLFFLRQDGHA